MIGAVVGVFVYGFLLFGLGSNIALYTLEITAFVAVIGILAILGWIGYVMATTPPPVPLEPEPAPTTSAPQSTRGNREESVSFLERIFRLFVSVNFLY